MAAKVWRCLEVELARDNDTTKWSRPTARASSGRDAFRRENVPLKPDLSLWAMYIHILLQYGYEAEALAVLSEMHAAGIPPTRRTLASWDMALLDDGRSRTRSVVR
eukprot:scaffold3037_cov230-Pinguiococcus_pyrenoidosus.AAC.6